MGVWKDPILRGYRNRVNWSWFAGKTRRSVIVSDDSIDTLFTPPDKTVYLESVRTPLAEPFNIPRNRGGRCDCKSHPVRIDS